MSLIETLRVPKNMTWTLFLIDWKFSHMSNVFSRSLSVVETFEDKPNNNWREILAIKIGKNDYQQFFHLINKYPQKFYPEFFTHKGRLSDDAYAWLGFETSHKVDQMINQVNDAMCLYLSRKRTLLQEKANKVMVNGSLDFYICKELGCHYIESCLTLSPRKSYYHGVFKARHKLRGDVNN
jgi:hypothetical protein